MTKHDNMGNTGNTGHNNAALEAGQIVNPERFPHPSELVCVQVRKVFDQVALRECRPQSLRLESTSSHPKFTFESIGGFDIKHVEVTSRTDSMTRPGFKKLRLTVTIGYTVHYSDGCGHEEMHETDEFPLTINEIYCPSCLTQIGVVRYPEEKHETMDEDGLLIKVEAIIEAFNETLNPTSGMLTFDIGAFFVIKCECEVQLLIPSYGYCPVPPEQANIAAQNCITFNDRSRTPFPQRFYPDQKWNPLE